ncbi:MAG: ferredoxin--NADP reductase [Bryobacteraceae bacterium]
MEARLITSREIAPGVRHFEFEALGVKRLDFVPGQFTSFTDVVEGKEITRAYSLASAPSGTNRFELCLNRVEPGHLSPRLFEMKPGDRIEMRQPLGMFVLRQQAPRDSTFIATGTGIAPFRSMLQAHLSESSPAFTLLFGVRYESHLLYREEFEEMARTHPNFRFWPTLTRPGASWKGRQGRVQTHLAEAISLLNDRRDVDFYLCGLKEMVDETRGMLKGQGFERKQIFYEKYD